jgi:predicted esterase
MNMRSAFLCLAPILSVTCFAYAADNPASDGSSSELPSGTGRYSQSATLASLVGETGARRFAASFAPEDELQFDVYVPDNYDPSVPAGLFVFVSPVASGRIPVPWQEVFDRRNLIWVSVNDSGNAMLAAQRLAEARLASAFVLKNHEIDPRRTYISGMSGGAQIATIAASLYPELFKGGMFLCGVNPWSERDADPWVEDPPESLELIRKNRYVFLSGTEDFKLAAVARTYRLFKKAGIDNVKLLVIEDMAHELPVTGDFDRALEFLDANSTVPVANSAEYP